MTDAFLSQAGRTDEPVPALIAIAMQLERIGDLIEYPATYVVGHGNLSIGHRVNWANDGHTNISVFIGKYEGSRGNCGRLTLRTDEYAELNKINQFGMRIDPHIPVPSHGSHE